MTEIHGATRPMAGRVASANQDAFEVSRVPVPWAALCDGAGNAAGVAKRALALFDTGMKAMTLGQTITDSSWIRLAKSIDRVLAGGSETTLVAAAVVAGHAVGVVVGDSRVYHVALDGKTTQLGEAASKARLGSGDAAPVTFHATMAPKDVLVLASDGVWTALSMAGIDRVVRSWTTKDAAELPAALLDAIRGTLADDCTAVILKA